MRLRDLIAYFLAATSVLCGQERGPRPDGKWWTNPETAQRLGLSAEQQKKMDEVMQQNRVKLIDLRAALEKEEAAMEGFMRAPQPEDARVLPAIDRIAQARAELEKANARLMLAMRHVLTPEQWEKLHDADGAARRDGPPPRRDNGPAPRPGPPPAPREE